MSFDCFTFRVHGSGGNLHNNSRILPYSLVINVRLVYKLDINLPQSVSFYLNVSFIQSTILDSLQAFQVINKKETLIIDKLFCFKINMS